MIRSTLKERSASYQTMAVIAQGGSASREPSSEPSAPQMEQILPYIDYRPDPF